MHTLWPVLDRGDRRQVTRVALVVVGIALLGGLGLAYWAVHRKAEHATEGGPGTVGIRLVPSRPEYRDGEEVAISIILTNRETRACRMSRGPEGTITILSLTRDGIPIVPSLTTATYIDGFSRSLLATLMPVTPGASRSLLLTSVPDGVTDGRSALPTSELDGNDEATLSFWPVDQPGHYTLTADYLLPPLAGPPTGLCPTFGGPASTSFTVMQR
jgi:hypothetical protein